MDFSKPFGKSFGCTIGGPFELFLVFGELINLKLFDKIGKIFSELFLENYWMIFIVKLLGQSFSNYIRRTENINKTRIPNKQLLVGM